MAAGIINLQKASGGVTKISSADGTGVTELVVPESGELANKGYVDAQDALKVALADFIGANQSLASSGYQKLPGGLIIQWGRISFIGQTSETLNFPIAFPNNVFAVSTGEKTICRVSSKSNSL